jgi:colicin import membrane protein
MTFLEIIKKNPSVLIWAIIVHVLAFVAIGVSFKSSDPNISAVKQIKVIEAVAIDESKIQEEINKLKKADKRKKRDQKRLQDKAKKAKRDRRKEEKKLQALKKKQKEQEKLNKNKRIQENKRRAESERKQKVAEEKLNKLEKQRQEKQALLEKEENERQEKIAEKKRALEQQKQAAYEQREVAKYKGLIRNQITRNWIFPASYQKGMKCKVLVRLIPSGDVVSVRIIQSSGNAAFDRSVEMAVNKASPLPVPKSSTGLFDHFREVEFVFDPNA